MGLTPFCGHRLSGLCGRCGEPVLEGYRADLAECGVASAAVVDVLDPGADRAGRLGPGREGVPVVVLGLQGGPEALLLGVVPAHPGAPDGQTHAESVGDLGELGGVCWRPLSAWKTTPSVSPWRKVTARRSAVSTMSVCGLSEKAYPSTRREQPSRTAHR